MKLIRKLIATWPAAAALCAVIALALAVTVSAAGSHRSQPASTASAQTQDVSAQTETVSDIALTPQAVTPSAPCTAARQAVTKALADEKAEDATEKTNAKKAGAAVTDVGEDKTEQATLKPLSDAVRAACAGQPATPPTAACMAAKQALKTAMAPDKDEDTKEKTSSTEKSTADQAEDKLEADALKSQQTTVHTACGSSTK